MCINRNLGGERLNFDVPVHERTASPRRGHSDRSLGMTAFRVSKRAWPPNVGCGQASRTSNRTLLKLFRYSCAWICKPSSFQRLATNARTPVVTDSSREHRFESRKLACRKARVVRSVDRH
ncbi:hypothetical protein CBM2586_B130531 [Cupriavidus phytorum]|uniref:Uncharacterized protein n=1 Tax=Cupriavidus taiwanensis TaxID=164546 RepID=A0A375CIU2_9BURK|nr:hypothetical protein CBM2586_B130531 [Cupriavidus taiwanensis]